MAILQPAVKTLPNLKYTCNMYDAFNGTKEKKEKTAPPLLQWNLSHSDFSLCVLKLWGSEWSQPLSITSVVCSLSQKLLQEIAKTWVITLASGLFCTKLTADRAVKFLIALVFPLLFSTGLPIMVQTGRKTTYWQSWHGDSVDKELKHVKHGSSAEN